MNKNKQVWLGALLLAAALGGAALTTGFSVMRFAQARQTETPRKEKWEYCAIIYAYKMGDNFGRLTGRASIRYFGLNGSREEIVEAQAEKDDHPFGMGREVMAKAMAKLGNEGWEMIGRESNKNGPEHDFIYFKRLKQ